MRLEADHNEKLPKPNRINRKGKRLPGLPVPTFFRGVVKLQGCKGLDYPVSPVIMEVENGCI